MEHILTNPKLPDIFRLLREGRHLCLEDGQLYEIIEGNASEFTALFRSLGYVMEHHRKGIYYFRGDSPVPEIARRLAVFTFILVEHLGDTGQSVEESVFTTTFSLEDLPHLQSERYRETMSEVGIGDADSLLKMFRTAQRLGFVELLTDDRVQMRRPLYRLLDLCTRVLTLDEESNEDSEETV